MEQKRSRDPFDRASAFWDMASPMGFWRFPFELECLGTVRFERLSQPEAAASLARGLSGFACHLENGCLSLNQYRARALRPQGDSFTLYIRAKLDSAERTSLFSSDFLGLTVQLSGLISAFAAQEIPTGRTYREIPLAWADCNGWRDYILTLSGGMLRLYCGGTLKAEVPMHWKIHPGFSDDLVIGARRCCKPDTYDTAAPHSRVTGWIGAAAIWQEALSREEIAFLSGVEELTENEAPTALDAACKAYNEFFDASARRDIRRCAQLDDILRRTALQDPSRPRYHLTQPFGAIFDPVGAFYHEGKYHIFSYHNINYLLEYSSLDHYVSDDLIHWTQYPIGPFADSGEDVFCIYLMNHFYDETGALRALYTGQGLQGKCGVLAQPDEAMVTYTAKQVVLPDFHHDGHVFRHDGRWYTITSRMSKGLRPDGKGDAVVLYRSDDLKHWTLEGEIFHQPITPQNPKGFLEFPYLLFFGEKAVLMVGGDIRYYTGTFDWEEKRFIPDDPEGVRLDPVNPFYCFNPMCVDDKDGGAPRRIIMGLYPNVGSEEASRLPWSGVHTMPRVLTLEDGCLRQEPVPEAQSLRGPCHEAERVFLCQGEQAALDGTFDPYVEISAVFRDWAGSDFGLIIKSGSDEVKILFSGDQKRYSVTGGVMQQGMSTLCPTDGEQLDMRVFVDSRLVESYISGQVCTTALAGKVPGQLSVSVVCERGSVECETLRVWEMKTDLPLAKPDAMC